MHFNKKYILAAFILILVSLGCYLYYRNETKFVAVKTIGEFTIQTAASDTPGFCGDDRVVRTRDSLRIVTLRLCENNITEVISQGDVVTVQTNCGRYQKNLKTGRGELITAECMGGMSVVW